MTDTPDHTPPPPAARDLATLPASTLVVPITVTSAYLERTLDEVLERIRPEQGLLYQHEGIDLGGGLTATAQVWRRSHTHVAMADNAINATLPVRVVLVPAWQPQLGPLSLPVDIPLPLDVSAEYTVRLRARPHLDRDYNLRLNAVFDYAVDRAVGVEAVGVGVTLSGASRRAAEEALGALAQWLNSDDFHYLNFRAEAERGWEALQEPFVLSPGHHLRLAISPQGVHALPFCTRGDTGMLRLAFVARIRAEAGAAEALAHVPLPALSAGEVPEGISLALPLAVSFASLEAALQDNVTHHPWHIDGRQVLLREVEVTGSDDGRLAARVEVSVTSGHGGYDVEASLSASGVPRLDIERQHLSLDDFRYDIHSDRTLVNVVATLLRPFTGSILEPWLRLPLEPQAERALHEVNLRLEKGIALADGVTLHGRAAGVRLTGLAINAHALSVMVETHGELSVEITHAA